MEVAFVNTLEQRGRYKYTLDFDKSVSLAEYHLVVGSSDLRIFIALYDNNMCATAPVCAYKIL